MRISTITFMLATVVSIAQATSETTQKTQLESLLNSALPVAQKMLASEGGFYPYGATMSPKGLISNTGAELGLGDHPNPAEVAAFLKSAYRSMATSKTIMACALIADVTIQLPNGAGKSDAIKVALDHRDGMSVIMLYPYHIGPEKKVTFAPPIAQKGLADVFIAK